MSTLSEDIKPYLTQDEWGLVALERGTKGRTLDNHVLFSATYLFHAEAPRNDRLSMPYSDYSRFYRFLDACKIEAGLIKRYPSDPGVQAHDDMIGIAAIYSSLAREMLDYGRRQFWSWNTEHPGVFTWRTWFYRIGAFIPFLKARAGEKLNAIDRWNVRFAFTHNMGEPRGETSGRCLLYLMSFALEAQGGMCATVIRAWRSHCEKLYRLTDWNGVERGGVQAMYATYFGPNHPLTQHAPPDFGPPLSWREVKPA